MISDVEGQGTWNAGFSPVSPATAFGYQPSP
jgi:hypothetical protein